MDCSGGPWSTLFADEFRPLFPQCFKKEFFPEIIKNRDCLVNPFPQNKILDQTELKAFADDKLNVPKMIISIFD